MTPDLSVFTDLVIIIGASLPVLLFFRRLGLPAIAGFVMVGLLIGPTSLGWVNNTHNIQVAADIGVVLLLFSIGLEFSLSRLLSTPVRLFLIAAGQILGTALTGCLIAIGLGLSSGAAIVIGFAVSLSSSAIVLKGLVDRGELETPIGRLVVTICVVQDLAVAPMLLVLGFLSAETISIGVVALSLARITALGLAIYLMARLVLPRLLSLLMTVDLPEVVLLFSVLVMLATAWATHLIGLSLAIGAFAAGLILSETDYYPQIYADVAPFRSLFSSLFFVSIGMLLDLGFVTEHPLPVVLVVLGVLVVKSVLVVLASLPFGVAPRISMQSGFYLAQMGEFAFLLFGVATAGKLLTFDETQYLLAASVLTLAVTPLIMQWAPRLAWPAAAKLTRISEGDILPSEGTTRPQTAILIVGYGLNGQNVARVLRESGLYYEILDSNPGTVQRARRDGERIHYGDVTSREVLRQIGAGDFDTVVVAISDPAATRRAVSMMRALRPTVHLIVRTRHVREVEELTRLGASVVVPEEFETSLRIFSDVLTRYRIPPHIIAAEIELARSQSYGVLRAPQSPGTIENLHTYLLGRLVEVVFVIERRAAVGQTPVQLGLTGDRCSVLSILRHGTPLPTPLDETPIEPLDIVVLYGDHEALNHAVSTLTRDG